MAEPSKKYIEFNGTTILVRIANKLDCKKLKITLLTPGWHTTLYPIFANCNLAESYFPEKVGIYLLEIGYDNRIFYYENWFLNTESRTNKISISLFEEDERFFCKFDCEEKLELNKLVVLTEKPEHFRIDFDSSK